MVTGVDGKQTTFTVEQLRQMPKETAVVDDPHTKARQEYQGVPLAAVLAAAGVPSGSKLHGAELRDYMVVSASDGYMVVFSLFELDPPSHETRVLLAYGLDGAPLTGNNGALKLITPDDKRPERSVRMVTGITIRQVAGPAK